MGTRQEFSGDNDKQPGGQEAPASEDAADRQVRLELGRLAAGSEKLNDVLKHVDE